MAYFKRSDIENSKTRFQIISINPIDVRLMYKDWELDLSQKSEKRTNRIS